MRISKVAFSFLLVGMAFLEATSSVVDMPEAALEAEENLDQEERFIEGSVVGIHDDRRLQTLSVDSTVNCYGGSECFATSSSNAIQVFQYPAIQANCDLTCTLSCDGSSAVVLAGGAASSEDSFSASLDSDGDGSLSNSADTDENGSISISVDSDGNGSISADSDGNGSYSADIRRNKAVVKSSCPITINVKASANGNFYAAAYDSTDGSYISNGALTCTSTCAAAASGFRAGLRKFFLRGNN